MAYIVWHNLEKNKESEQFLSDHRCRSVSATEPKTSVGLDTTEGKARRTVSVEEPRRKCWVCDDTLLYCR